MRTHRTCIASSPRPSRAASNSTMRGDAEVRISLDGNLSEKVATLHEGGFNEFTRRRDFIQPLPYQV